MVDAVEVAAPAKINLYLHVVGRRPDGYHLIDSLIAFAGVHDTIRASRANELSLKISGQFGAALESDEDNLVLRAARTLAERAGVDSGARLELVKRLPVASGIGGGSADAAATLTALMRLWRLNKKTLDLPGLALDLGADVPICLHGRASFVGGIGETVDPCPTLPGAWLVLVNPGSALSTAAVFGARKAPFSVPMRFDVTPKDVFGLATLLAERRNDLESPAMRLLPVVARVMTRISATDGCLLARMSGSGATCFGLFASQDSAARAAESLRSDAPDWWVMPTPLIADTGGVNP